jgi:hypothetical protein
MKIIRAPRKEDVSEEALLSLFFGIKFRTVY